MPAAAWYHLMEPEKVQQMPIYEYCCANRRKELEVMRSLREFDDGSYAGTTISMPSPASGRKWRALKVSNTSTLAAMAHA